MTTITLEHDENVTIYATCSSLLEGKALAQRLCEEYDAAMELTDGDPDTDALRVVGYTGPQLEGCAVIVTSDEEPGYFWSFEDQWVRYPAVITGNLRDFKNS